MTSHDVVAAVRRSLGGVRTGHAGTLDPFATGLLLVLVGRATKAQSALMELPKRYETIARLGAVSSTGDTEGRDNGDRPPARRPARAADGNDSTAPADALGGKDQRRARLPARSSRRALRDARARGHVYRFEELWREREPIARAGFQIECAAGTYVRSLIAELNDAYCLTLRRTAIGPFEVTDAVAPPARGALWRDPPLIAVEQALGMAAGRAVQRAGGRP